MAIDRSGGGESRRSDTLALSRLATGYRAFADALEQRWSFTSSGRVLGGCPHCGYMHIRLSEREGSARRPDCRSVSTPPVQRRWHIHADGRGIGSHQPSPCSGGMEYVRVAYATRLLEPFEYNDTPPTASERSTFRSAHSPMTRACADGLRRKLMVKLVVAANGTMPI